MAFEIDSIKLEAFYTVANTKNFSKAAKILGLTQSALSQRVARLEDQLEQTLFVRKPKNISLTSYGEKLLRYCHVQKNLEDEFFANSERSEAGELKGMLRIAGYSSVMRSLIIPCLSSLAKKNPLLHFEFITDEIDHLPDLFSSGGCDLLIYPSILEKEGIEVVTLAEEENVEILSVKKNAREDYLDHNPQDRTTLEFLRLQGKKNLSIKRSYLGDIYGIIDGVKQGFGKAIVSKHLVIGDKEIKILNSKKKMKNAINLCYYQKNYLPQSHIKVIEVLHKEIKNLVRHGKNHSKSRL